MTTFVSFVPSTISAFSFQPTLGGNPYIVTVLWNVFRQGYYISVSDISGNLILYRSLVATGPSYPASFSWAQGTVTAALTANHNVPICSVVAVNISETDSGFDGTYQALSTGAQTLTYPLPANPNQSNPISGNVNFALNLVSGYVANGWLVFHYDSQTFEFS